MTRNATGLGRPSSRAYKTHPQKKLSSFADLGVPEFIVKCLERRGITYPFEIQLATISDAIAGRDVCGRAPTGSGKTIAFGVPLVINVRRAKPNSPRALILVPTRELAEQIGIEIRTFCGKSRIGIVYGGVGYRPQFSMLKEGVEILVACPGRLEDLVSQNKVRLSSVEHLVLDEADRMADMGFMPAVRRIVSMIPVQRQTMLFSATLDKDVAQFTNDYQQDPVFYKIGSESPDVVPATHIFWNVLQADRVSVTAKSIDALWPSIVFCRTRRGADRLAKNLLKLGLQVVVIHGGRSQYERARAVHDFTNNKVQALIASDVASRGLHIEGVESVIHFDPPEDYKAYIHRSGRTARAGRRGVVLSLVQSNQIADLQKIQRKVGLDEKFTDPDVAKLRSIVRFQTSNSGLDSRPNDPNLDLQGKHSNNTHENMPNGKKLRLNMAGLTGTRGVSKIKGEVGRHAFKRRISNKNVKGRYGKHSGFRRLRKPSHGTTGRNSKAR